MGTDAGHRPIGRFTSVYGGWTVVLLPLAAWGLFSFLDVVMGLDERNADTDTPVDALLWYRAITWIWAPVQIGLVFWALWFLTGSVHGTLEKLALAFGFGIMSGTVGIVYAHELMHQPGRAERWLGDILMGFVQYGHFRTEHLLVHHPHVATPRDAVTARYNEGFHRFFDPFP